jgi:hypothetical protein
LSTLAIAGLALGVWVSQAAAFVPANENHYVCHQVKDLKTPKFVTVTNSWIDQDSGSFCDAKKPYLLCDPASKDSGPIPDLTLHYCCYLAKCAFNATATHFISDQFGVHQVGEKKNKFVCNPCDKF